MSSEAETKKQGIAGVFARSAATYDQVGPRFFTHFGQRLVELAALRPGAKVLDVAAGRGATLFPAAVQVGPTGEVVGIDLAAGMVEQTSREIAARGAKNAQMLPMDTEQLDFPAGNFDYVLCGFALFFFPNLEQALAEFRRVLKTGGRLAASTWGEGDARWRWLDQLRQANQPPNQANASDPAFDKPEGMQAIMQAAGFVNVAVVAEEMDFTYTDEDEWWATQWSHGARAELESLPEQALVQGKVFVHQKLAEMTQPDGNTSSFGCCSP
jgi:ubiquinone/menaquinone biosynthesis C-methylase UbiE